MMLKPSAVARLSIFWRQKPCRMSPAAFAPHGSLGAQPALSETSRVETRSGKPLSDPKLPFRIGAMRGFLAAWPGEASGLPDFMAGETLEHASHAGMVPCRAACGDRGVEQLLARGRIRQANAKRARTLQRQVKILLM
jgi:hypothetical protein